MNFAREFAQLNLENLNTPIFQGIAVEIPFQQGAPLKHDVYVLGDYAHRVEIPFQQGAPLKLSIQSAIALDSMLKSPSSKGHR